MSDSSHTQPPDTQKTDARLGVIRQDIDSIDAAILELLAKRAACSREVGAIKAETKAPVFRPAREQQLIDHLLQQNNDNLPPEHLRAIYREIIASSRALQRPQRVAYLGPEGTFSHMAGLEYFGEALTYTPMDDFEDIFAAVVSRDCELGVIPLENSLHGTVARSLDLFARHNVYVLAEWYTRIRHSLLTNETSFAAIHTVYSHPQPLGQCAIWLRKHLPQAKLVPLESTAAGALRAAGEPGSAAIGHMNLGPRSGLTVLAQGLEDTPDNWTRFFAIGPTPPERGTADKSSVLFTVNDKPGTLLAVLQCFADAGINLQKLESRPLPGERWKYVFFADLCCDLEAPELVKTLHTVQSHCLSFRILGAYHSGYYVQPTE